MLRPFFTIRNRVVPTALAAAALALVLGGVYLFTDIFVASSVSLTSESTPGNWSMFRRDLSRSGVIDPAQNAPAGTVAWTFATGGPVSSSPAVVDGIVYFGSSDFNLYALDAATGAKLWEFKTGSWVESSPAVVDGVVYFGSNDGNFYALNAKTGREKWRFRTPYPIRSSPAVADGTVYFGADDFRFYAVKTSNGKKRWSFTTEERVLASPAVANGLVYFASADGSLYVLGSRTGRFRLRFKTTDSIVSSPVVSSETLYFGSSNGYLYAVDGNAQNWPAENALRPYWDLLWIQGLLPASPAKSGYLWTLNLGETILPSPGRRPIREVAALATSPVLGTDRLYIGGGNKMFAVDPAKSEITWTFEAGALVRSSPALAGNTLYFGSDDGRIYAIDAASGEKRWDVPTGDKVIASPAVAGAMLYVGSHDGKLYAIK